MSAYLVTDEHIDAILTVACDRATWRADFRWLSPAGQLREITAETADVWGQKLKDENYASVSYRYRSTDPSLQRDDTLPGPIDWSPVYSFRPLPGHITTDVLKMVANACAGYSYQSCEHDGWHHSDAHAFITALMVRILGQLTEDAGGWNIDDRTAFLKSSMVSR